MEHLAAASALLAAASDSGLKAVEIGQWIGAALTLVLTAALVMGVRWALRQRTPLQFADPGVKTRVRLVQRMGVTVVVLIGIAVAAAQIGILGGIASTVLGASAISAIVVGFAARATLANAMAGIVLTITQPVRVGDNVRIGEHEGTVEDVTLSATVLRTVHGTTIRIPNELLAQSVVRNDTISGGGVLPEAEVLLPFGTPMDRALEVAAGLPGINLARHAGIEAEGWNKLIVRGDRCAPGDRIPAEARMRFAVTVALTDAGLMHGAEPRQEPADHL